MKVYVITSGEYSDYHICAVAQSEKKANALKKLFDTQNYTGAKIEVYDTKTYQTSRPLFLALYDKQEKKLELIRINEGEEYQELPTEREMNEIVPYGVFLRTGINANSRKQAEKIFYDRLAKYKAEQNGLT